ncbi:MAG: DUF5924 family protein, partial [Pseudomonadota bacterium]
PWTWLWPPVAFAAGLGSLFLVDRQQWLGAALALGLLFAWVLLLTEGVISRWLVRRGYPAFPRGVTTFIAQMVHQETLFFTLPFILATTVWNSGQALFALMVVAMAILSITDPLYYKVAEKWRSAYFVFHAHCVFLVTIVTLPIMLKLTTAQSLLLALGVMVLTGLPIFLHLMEQRTWRGWMIFGCLALLLAGAGWVGRIWVPPATLWMAESALSPDFNIEQREPEGSMVLTPLALKSRGLYVYTAIRAPRGLSETITHDWHQNGERLDTIDLDIDGGREEGYRAWSHKMQFPEDPAGQWRVDIMTAGGQRLGLVRFTVSEDEEEATRVDSQIRASGLRKLDLQRFIPGQSQPSDD